MTPNKEIRRLRLTVTTKCCCRCSYCCIEKKEVTMRWITARRAIDLLLASPGKAKTLFISGGEPTIVFPLVKKIILYAKHEALRKKARLTLSLATNAVLLRKKHVTFLNREGVRVSISTFGRDHLNNMYRKTKSGKAISEILNKKITMVFRFMDVERVSALLCVHPATAGDLFQQFLEVLEKGFQKINIEPVLMAPWSAQVRKVFLRNLRLIYGYLFEELKQGRFLFVHSFDRSFRKIPHYGCLLDHTIDVFPDGTLSLVPYYGRNIGKKGCVGQLPHGLFRDYTHCLYGKDAQECRRCKDRFWQSFRRFPGSEVVLLRDAITRDFMNVVRYYGEHNKNCGRYLREFRKQKFE